MKPSELYEAPHALIGQRVPCKFWGACGVGKSQIPIYGSLSLLGTPDHAL